VAQFIPRKKDKRTALMQFEAANQTKR